MLLLHSTHALSQQQYCLAKKEKTSQNNWKRLMILPPFLTNFFEYYQFLSIKILFIIWLTKKKEFQLPTVVSMWKVPIKDWSCSVCLRTYKANKEHNAVNLA